MARLGGALLITGLLVVAFGVMWQLGLAPGSRVALPEPVAVVSLPATQGPVSPTAESQFQIVTPMPLKPTPIVQIQAAPTSTPAPYVPADAADRAVARPTPTPEAGYAVRLTIDAIGLDTTVMQGRVVQDTDGNAVWETLPFVAVHYGDLTALIGARGNAVIAGHVVTRTEGNVFRQLYQVNLDDQVQVWDDVGREHGFRVVDVKLVLPSDTWVMAPTPDETLTLITCGGSFDPIKREFSHRLVVTAKPA